MTVTEVLRLPVVMVLLFIGWQVFRYLLLVGWIYFVFRPKVVAWLEEAFPAPETDDITDPGIGE